MPPDNEVERRAGALDTVRILTQVEEGVKYCVEGLANNTQAIDKVFKILQGNDGDGIVTRMKIAEGDIDDNAEAIEGHKEAHTWWRRSIARCGIVIAGSGLAAVIIYLIKVM